MILNWFVDTWNTAVNFFSSIINVGSDIVSDFSEGFINLSPDKFFDGLFKTLTAGFNIWWNTKQINIISTIYELYYNTFNVFLYLANFNIFGNTAFKLTFDNIISKIYLVLGVLTLFIIAYNIIMFIIDPAKDKGSQEATNLIKKTLSTILIIILCPFIFNLLPRIQSAVFTSGTINRIISDTDTKTSQQASDLVIKTFRLFYDVNPNSSQYAELSKKLEETDQNVSQSGNFNMYAGFVGYTVTDDIQMNSFLLKIIGIYCCYVMISFCIDMGIRCIKLVFYQIISPICIACRMIPKKEQVFKTWLSTTLKTYLSVFIHIFILVMTLALTDTMIKSWTTVAINPTICQLNGINNCLSTMYWAQIFLILALITFMKTATKMICEIFGIDDVKIRLGQKLKEQGVFMAGAAVAAGATNAIRSGKAAYTKSKTEGNKKSTSISKAIGSGTKGLIGGIYQGGKAGRDAGSLTSMFAATKSAMNNIENNNAQKQKDRIEGNTGINKVKRWFTGAPINKIDASNTIVSTGDSIKNKAIETIENNVAKGKHNNYALNNNDRFEYMSNAIGEQNGAPTPTPMTIAKTDDNIKSIEDAINAARNENSNIAGITYSDGQNNNTVNIDLTEAIDLLRSLKDETAKSLATAAAVNSETFNKYSESQKDLYRDVYNENIKYRETLNNPENLSVVSEIAKQEIAELTKQLEKLNGRDIQKIQYELQKANDNSEINKLKENIQEQNQIRDELNKLTEALKDATKVKDKTSIESQIKELQSKLQPNESLNNLTKQLQELQESQQREIRELTDLLKTAKNESNIRQTIEIMNKNPKDWTLTYDDGGVMDAIKHGAKVLETSELENRLKNTK